MSRVVPFPAPAGPPPCEAGRFWGEPRRPRLRAWLSRALGSRAAGPLLGATRARFTVTRTEPLALDDPGIFRITCFEGVLWLTGDRCSEVILQPFQQVTLRSHGRVVAQGLPSARVELRWLGRDDGR